LTLALVAKAAEDLKAGKLRMPAAASVARAEKPPSDDLS
jgi:hypothetical protein